MQKSFSCNYSNFGDYQARHGKIILDNKSFTHIDERHLSKEIYHKKTKFDSLDELFSILNSKPLLEQKQGKEYRGEINIGKKRYTLTCKKNGKHIFELITAFPNKSH